MLLAGQMVRLQHTSAHTAAVHSFELSVYADEDLRPAGPVTRLPECAAGYILVQAFQSSKLQQRLVSSADRQAPHQRLGRQTPQCAAPESMKCAQFQALQTGLAHYERFQDKHQRQKAEGAQVGHSAARDIQAERGARLRERADSSSASSHSDAGPPGQVHFTTGWTPHALVSARCSLPTSYVLVALGTMPASSSTVCTPQTRPSQTLGCHCEYQIDAHGACSTISLCMSRLRL